MYSARAVAPSSHVTILQGTRVVSEYCRTCPARSSLPRCVAAARGAVKMQVDVDGGRISVRVDVHQGNWCRCEAFPRLVQASSLPSPILVYSALSDAHKDVTTLEHSDGRHDEK